MHLFSTISSFGKHHPKFRSALSPVWQDFVHLLWIVRRSVFAWLPVTFTAGDQTLSMIPQGQIAEYLWRSSFEKRERDLAARAIKPGMRVLNIGANAGLYTLIASRLVGPSGIVHAFEPSSQSFGRLKRNIELNGCSNVKANNMAVSNFQGQLGLYCDPLNPQYDGHFFVKRVSETSADFASPMEVIPCNTVDDYWREECGGEILPVDFIVIDVEGAELSVFQGARQTLLASPRLTMIMECTEQVDLIGDFLHECGFSFYNWEGETDRLQSSEIERGGLVAMRGAGRVVSQP